MRARKKKITVQQILVYAALCIAVFLSIFPIYWMIVASLKPVSETMAGFESLRIHHLTLENYQKVNAVVPMLNPVINSMFTMTMGTITSLLFCSLAGFAFAKFRFPGRDQLFMVVLLTLFIPQEVCVVPLYSVMRKLKLVNSLWSLIIPRAASALGIFYMRQYCMAIPNELIEASRIDGASPFKQFTKITLPYVLFVTTPYLITQFVGNINNFNVIWLLSGGGPMTGDYYQGGRTDLLITWLYRITTGEQNYKLASVIGILTFLVCAVFSLAVYARTSKSGEGDFQ